jgi:ATP-dependent Zn protease
VRSRDVADHTPSIVRTAAIEAAALVAPGDDVLDVRRADVGLARTRRWRLRLAVVAALVGYFGWAWSTGRRHLAFALPHVDPLIALYVATPLLFLVVTVAAYGWSGRSPHVLYRPEQIDVRLGDVVGIDAVKEEVIRSLNLFLAHKSFSRQMGGRARRGLLFEGGPGTGKTHTAKAMAAEAGVPFLFASASSFQSSFYGATARKIRQYFKELRKAARREGGAIGFIDEFDAIAGARRGLEMSTAPALMHCGGLDGLPMRYAESASSVVTPFGTSDLAGPVVNELLVQLQSFDEPSGPARVVGVFVDLVNRLLPPGHQLPKPMSEPANIMLVASTNRADGLDPALLRPGRFDRRLHFEAPSRAGRRQLVDHFLARKAHEPELDNADQRDAIAAVTTGYTPAMIEGLLDEALINAVRRGATAMNRSDVEQARLTTELGLANPTAYTVHEKRLVATHEAGHTVVAYLAAPTRRLEVLSIIKRRGSLGLLAHGDVDDVFTRSREELTALVRIALGGQCAEELFFGDISTGPGSDLLYATNIVAEMVGSVGMADSLVSYAAIQNSPLSDTNMVGRVLGDAHGRRAVEAFLQEQKRVVSAMLREHRHLVEALRDALIERDELIGREITEVLEAARPAPQVIDLTVVEPQLRD